jgi:hypothetical protein
VFFTKRRIRDLPTSDLSLDGYSIPWIDRARYLGLILDKKLTFSPNFDYVSDGVQKLTRILNPLINKGVRSFFEKVLLCNAIFHPTILFSSVVWRGLC